MKPSLLAKFLLAMAAIAGVFFVFSFLDDTSETWPNETWQTAAPETGGFDSSRLAIALEEALTQNPNLHAIFLVTHGKAVLDAEFYPYDGKYPHNLASVTKSVMTTLICIAADQGKLSLDQPVLSFFPDRKILNRDDRKERITIRHLASMSSGLDCVGEHDEPTLSHSPMFGQYPA